MFIKRLMPEVIFAMVPTGQAYLQKSRGIKKAAIRTNKAIDTVVITHQ